MELTDQDRASVNRVIAVLDEEAKRRAGSAIELMLVEVAEEFRNLRRDDGQQHAHAA